MAEHLLPARWRGQALRRPGGHRRRRSHGAAGRDPRADRPQRRGQDHAGAPDLGSAARRRGRGAVRGHRHHRLCRCTSACSVAWRAPTRSPASSGASRVLENVALAVQAGAGSSLRFWAPAQQRSAHCSTTRPPGARASRSVGARAMSSPAAWRTANSGSWRWRWRSPPARGCCCWTSRMAGMGPEESARMVELIASLRGAGDPAAHRARHGRGVPAGGPDFGAGVRARDRERHARGDPGERARCGALTWATSWAARHERAAGDSGLEAGYGASQVLFGRRPRGPGGRGRHACSGRNGMGKTTTVRAVLGLVRGRARAA